MRFFIMPTLGTLLLTLSLSASAEDVSPTNLYLQYRKALTTATAVDAVTPFMCKKVTKEIESTPTEMRVTMFGLIKELSPKLVKVTSEKIDGDQASLELVDETPKQLMKGETETEAGTVTLVREDGAWKIDKESWKCNSAMTDSPSEAGKQSPEKP